MDIKYHAFAHICPTITHTFRWDYLCESLQMNEWNLSTEEQLETFCAGQVNLIQTMLAKIWLIRNFISPMLVPIFQQFR